MSRVFVLLAALSIAVPVRAGTPIFGFQESVFQAGLSGPTAIAFLPDGRLLIAEQGGALRLSDGSSMSTVATIPVCSDAEMGLLGIAVDPDFTSNRFVYLYRTDDSAGCAGASGRFNQVVRVTMAPDDTVDLSSLVVLVTGIQTDNGNHDGGCLRIGPDAKLYVSVGDTGLGDNQGGPGSSTNPYSQDPSVLMGKVLRVELDGSIPVDNPFVGQAGKRGEIFALGFRNPFRFSFDPMTGKLWLGDVGDETIEEIDLVTAGGNYAWPRCEGTRPTGCEQAGDVDPIFTYPHSGAQSLGECLIGGSFAPGGFGGLDGDYFFGDCVSSAIYSATPTGAQRDGIAPPALFVSAGDTPADLVFGPDGALYYVAESGGEVRRVAPVQAGGDQPIAGTRITLRDNADPAKKALSMQAKDAIVLGGPADDPTVAGGTLRVSSAAFDDTYPLPATGWVRLGRTPGHGWRYADRMLLAGPVKRALLRAGKVVRTSARGTQLGHSLATNPDPVSVVLTVGTRRYCASFGGTVTRFVAGGRYSAKLALAPAACP